MAKGIKQSITATLVGFEQYEYSGFTASDGKVVAGGTTHKVWVSTDPNDAPASVKCKGEAFAALRGLGFGHVVVMEVTYRAKGQAFEMTLDDFDARAPSPNGRSAVRSPA